MRSSFHCHQRGLTLVELMVALVLGLVVIGAVVNLFLTNRQTYRTTENLARMQENLRIAFELMARDVREAGATACGAEPDNIRNFLPPPADRPWKEKTLLAYAPGATIPSPAPSNVAANSPVLSLAKGSDPPNEVLVTAYDPTSGTLTLSSTAGLAVGDSLFVCKGNDAAIFQATSINNGNRTVVSPFLSNYNFTVDNTVANNGSFAGGTLLEFQPILWYIGTNGRGGTSLYRKVGNDNAMEMVPDIDQLTLAFLSQGGTAYQPIANVTAWPQVVAVRIVVRSVSTDVIGTDGQPLRREYPFTIALRSREPT